jgi:hypothetical protein
VAPNAARKISRDIATPGKEKSDSPLSAFARMMAKVVMDAAGEKKGSSSASAVEAARAETP